jgi:predicted RNase H-like HicB family nuclease
LLCRGRKHNEFDVLSKENIIKYMARRFTAIYKKSGEWYLGWVEEIPGVNTQGKTLKETKKNLKEALLLILETNRLLNKKEVSRGKIIRQPLSVSLK